MNKINVNGTEINVVSRNNADYICITDMLKAKDGEFFVTDWLRNRNTLEYIGTWENVYNPNFNLDGFEEIIKKAGLNSFKISVKEFVEKQTLFPSRQDPADMAAHMRTRTLLLNLLCGSVPNSKYMLSKNSNGLKPMNKSKSDGLPKENWQRSITISTQTLLSII